MDRPRRSGRKPTKPPMYRFTSNRLRQSTTPNASSSMGNANDSNESNAANGNDGRFRFEFSRPETIPQELTVEPEVHRKELSLPIRLLSQVTSGGTQSAKIAPEFNNRESKVEHKENSLPPLRSSTGTSCAGIVPEPPRTDSKKRVIPEILDHRCHTPRVPATSLGNPLTRFFPHFPQPHNTERKVDIKEQPLPTRHSSGNMASSGNMTTSVQDQDAVMSFDTQNTGSEVGHEDGSPPLADSATSSVSSVGPDEKEGDDIIDSDTEDETHETVQRIVAEAKG